MELKPQRFLGRVVNDMATTRLPVGSFVRIEKPDLQKVIDRLKSLGYRTIGPQVADAAIVYGPLDSVDQLPVGYLDEQDGGKYRLSKTDEDSYFSYVVGPHSLKNYLFPPQETMLELERKDGSWQTRQPEVDQQPLAVFGVRSCDLHALAVQDRIFLGDKYVDTAYKARRERLFLIAVQCGRAVATCFCHSMGTGPSATEGFDLAITEMDDFLAVEIGSPRGGEVISAAPWMPCTVEQVEEAQAIPARLEKELRQRRPYDLSVTSGKPRERTMDTTNIRDLLLGNLEHPRWQEVAQRCLACTNCTLVCPTCFCCSVDDVSDLTGDHVERVRSWDSCFTAEHSYTATGVVHKTIQARYRQWLTHKLASWIDQFGTSGCVGCGRCITWCPVGIDLTEEVAAIRGE
jgi:sulfhydrogenase subunit beta (sulfur reductase)